MEPVVRRVERDEVGAACTDQQAVEPQNEVDDPAADQIRPGAVPRSRQRQARDAEGQVDDVVNPADLEHVQELRLRAVAREVEAAVQVRCDARHEAEDPDE